MQTMCFSPKLADQELANRNHGANHGQSLANGENGRDQSVKAPWHSVRYIIYIYKYCYTYIYIYVI